MITLAAAVTRDLRALRHAAYALRMFRRQLRDAYISRYAAAIDDAQDFFATPHADIFFATLMLLPLSPLRR